MGVIIRTAAADEARFRARAANKWEPESVTGFYADGTGVYASIDEAVVGAGGYPFSFGGWFYKRAASSVRNVIGLSTSNSDDYFVLVGMETDGRPLVHADGTLGNTTQHSTAMNDEWVHVFCVLTNSSSRDLYVNGVYSVTGTVSALMPSLDRTAIGRLIRTSPVNYPGEFKGLYFYDSALTALQVASIYEGDAPSGASAIYLCDETEGVVLNDTSGNGKHMEVNGLDNGLNYYSSDIDGAALSDADLDGLLMEREAVNIITENTDYQDAQWSNGGGLTVTSGFTAPDGSSTAVKITEITEATAYLYVGGGFIADLNDANEVRSIWARSDSGNGLVSLLAHNSAAGAVFEVTSEWQKFEISTNNIGSTGATNCYAVDFRAAETTLTSVIVWGSQQEAGDYATSTITTEASSVTRSGDLLRLTNTHEIIAHVADGIGTLSAEIKLHGTTATTGDERVIFDLGGDVRCYVDDAGLVKATDGTNTVTGPPIIAKARHKIAWSFGGGNQALSVDGTAVTGAFSGSVAATVGIGCDADADQDQLDGYIRKLAGYSVPLWADQLNAITDNPQTIELTSELDDSMTFTRGSTGTLESSE